jgi:REP element-mobilizing transposase RayT
VIVEGGLYHVYNRFARGEGVFSDPEEAAEFAELLREVKKRDGLTIFAWALLSNHYHVAVRTSAIPLSRTMKHLQWTFSRRFNRRWKRTGPLWQSRYQARLIEDQDYLDKVMVYIHLNPVRAGLVGDPPDWVFSGHREIVGRVKKPLVDIDQALIGFGETLRKARRCYVNRVRAGLEEEAIDDSPRRLNLFAPPDRDLDAPPGVFVDELGRSTGLERPTLDANRFVNAACSILDFEIERLASRRRDSETAAARQLIAAVGIERWGQRAGRIAAVLDKHPVAVSRWVSEAARGRQADPKLEEKMTRLDEDLSEWALAAQARGELAVRGAN